MPDIKTASQTVTPSHGSPYLGTAFGPLPAIVLDDNSLGTNGPTLPARQHPTQRSGPAVAAPREPYARSTSEERREIVFVDKGVDGYVRFVAAITDTPARAVDVVLIETSRDGLAQITEALRGREGLSAIHIVSHGSAGKLQIGSSTVDAKWVQQNIRAIRGWAGALTDDADLLFYGCNVASTVDGRLLVEALSRLTGADVAASVDPAGSAALGGNWDLEYAVGRIETPLALTTKIQQNWPHLLQAGVTISPLAPTPLGNEFRVNTTTSGDQWVYYWSIRTIGVAADGSFVQVWIDTAGADGSQSGIFGQRFDASGNPAGGEFRVNTTTSQSQDNVSIGMAPDGSFIVLWDGPGDGSSTGIWGQRFLADGTRVGGEFLLNTTTAGQQKYPELDFAADGSFVAAWVSRSAGPEKTLFQRFDASANKVGAEVQLTTGSAQDQTLDSLEVLSDGSFIVTWTEAGDCYGQRYDAGTTPAPVGVSFAINQYVAGVQQYSIARADAAGNFAVVWESDLQDGSGNGIYGRCFAADGTALGNEFVLTASTAGDQYALSLIMDAAGNFVAVWTDGNALDGSAESVRMRRFDRNGTPLGTSIQVNQTTAGYQAYPVIGSNDSGVVVVGWEGNGPGDTYGVFARRYELRPRVLEGSTTTFTVVLNTAPTAPVTIGLSVSDATEASLGTNTLIFDGTNWSVPQTVTITGVQDFVIDGDVWSLVVTSAASSADPAYNGMVVADVPLVTIDASPTAVGLVSFAATRYGDGRVRVGWTTGYEVHNLGFRVYREAGGTLTRVTPGLVAGSALMSGGGWGRAAGAGYTWWDTPPAGAGAVRYYLEDVDLSGKATRYGPVTPTASESPAPDVPNSPLLNEFASAGGGPVSPVGAVPIGATRHAARPASARARAAVAALQAAAPGGPTLAQGRRTAPDAPGYGADVRRSAEALATQQDLAAGAAIKVAVREEGWYRLPYATLVTAGLPARVAPGRLCLFVDGVERPLRVIRARAGQDGPAEAIEFYGTGVDTPWADTRAYWLTWDGSGAVPRVPVVPASVTGADGPASFPFSVAIKDRSIFFGGLVNGEAENFFGALVTSEATDLPVRLAHVDATGAGALTVTLQGVTSDPTRPGNHQVAVLVNGAAVGQVVFDGQAHPTETFALPAGVLVEGENVVTLAALGGEADVSLVDVVQVTYAHTYTAEANRLRFTAAAQQAVTVGGFSQAGIRVIDITDPGAVTEVRGQTSGGAGGFAVRFRVPGSGPRTLLAFAAGREWAPAAVSANQPSAWHQAGRRADYVLIAPAAFRPALDPLAARRQAQGHTVAVVDIEDVFDEFSFGQKTPHALRDFLTRAQAAWKTPPRFVTLVGNATIDPRDYLGLGEPDWVPAQVVATTALETASDDWFVDATGDGVPDLAAIGRLPARSAAETATLVAKIVGYEEAGAGAWSDAVTFVADAPGPGDMDFGAALDGLRPLIPAAYAVTRIRRGELGTAAARAALLPQLDAGQAVVNYTGHGSVQIWHDQLLTTDDPPTLHNGPWLPVYVLMTCLNGLFQGLFPEESLAEALMRAPDGGAIAVWASSGLTEPEPQLAMNAAFYRALFDRRVATVGEAVVLAKRGTTDADVRRTWIFFGDPALPLKGRHVADDGGSAGAVQRSASSSPLTAPTVLAAPTVRSQKPGVGFDDSGRGESHLSRPSPGEGLTGASGPQPSARDGVPTDIPVPGDYNADGTTDLAVFRPFTGTWDILGQTEAHWGTEGDLPVPGDYNADGTTDLAVFRPVTGTWYILGQTEVQWGTEGDLPVPGDYRGDGTTQIAVFRPSNGTWHILGRTEVHWGAEGDLPVPGDFDGDGRLDLAVFRPSTGQWCIATSRSRDARAQTWTWGAAGDQPLAADFDGDGKADLTVFRPGSGRWFTAYSSTGFTTTSATPWGRAGDIPVPFDFNRDGLADIAVYRPSTGVWFVQGQFSVQWGAGGEGPVGSPIAGPASSGFVPK